MTAADFATNLRAARLTAGLTQRALAEQLGVSQPIICRLESGHRAPKLLTAERLAKALGCTLASLAGGA